MAGINLLQVHAFLYSALDRCRCWVWRTGRFTPRSKCPFICRIRASEDHKARIETFEKRIFRPNWLSHQDCSVI